MAAAALIHKRSLVAAGCAGLAVLVGLFVAVSPMRRRLVAAQDDLAPREVELGDARLQRGRLVERLAAELTECLRGSSWSRKPLRMGERASLTTRPESGLLSLMHHDTDGPWLLELEARDHPRLWSALQSVRDANETAAGLAGDSAEWLVQAECLDWVPCVTVTVLGIPGRHPGALYVYELEPCAPSALVRDDGSSVTTHYDSASASIVRAGWSFHSLDEPSLGAHGFWLGLAPRRGCVQVEYLSE